MYISLFNGADVVIDFGGIHSGMFLLQAVDLADGFVVQNAGNSHIVATFGKNRLEKTQYAE